VANPVVVDNVEEIRNDLIHQIQGNKIVLGCNVPSIAGVKYGKPSIWWSRRYTKVLMVIQIRFNDPTDWITNNYYALNYLIQR
jgi:hypothetical protein